MTSAPNAATVPEYSWPSITPARPPHSRRKCRSEPQIPQWLTSSRSSPGPGRGVGRSSTVTSRSPMKTAAGMVSGTFVMARGSPEPDTHVNYGPDPRNSPNSWQRNRSPATFSLPTVGGFSGARDSGVPLTWASGFEENHDGRCCDPGRHGCRRDGQARAGRRRRHHRRGHLRDRRRPHRSPRARRIRADRGARASSTSTRTTTRRCSGIPRCHRVAGTA